MNTGKKQMEKLNAHLIEANTLADDIDKQLHKIHEIIQVIDWYLITQNMEINKVREDINTDHMNRVILGYADYTTYLVDVKRDLQYIIQKMESHWDMTDEEVIVLIQKRLQKI